jgi:hypothetical protein
MFADLKDDAAVIPGIILTRQAALLDSVRRPDVQAVICEATRRSDWERELAAAVESGAFGIPRRTLTVGSSGEVAYAIEAVLPQNILRFESRLALIDDIVSLAERLESITRLAGVMLRVFTEAPSPTCGFHLDTVTPGLPPFGLLKVYNGPGTHFVDADAFTPMRDVLAFLARRVRLSRAGRGARAETRQAESDALQAMLAGLDSALPFLRAGAPIHEVKAGAMVAFRHLDQNEHWTDHPVGKAWVHCSPMAGPIRLVANLTPMRGGRDLSRS